jgi:hypothetical protein
VPKVRPIGKTYPITDPPEKQAARNRGQFVPGQSGNPLGKAAGTRDTLTREFFRDLAAVYREHGQAALEHLATNDRGTFVRIVAALMPKEITIDEERRVYRISDRPLTPEEWAAEHCRDDDEPARTH